MVIIKFYITSRKHADSYTQNLNHHFRITLSFMIQQAQVKKILVSKNI